jgi:CBS domain-containing protein
MAIPSTLVRPDRSPLPDARPLAFWPLLEARDLMKHPIVAVDRTCPLAEVERILREHDVSGVAVTEGGPDRIVGVVSMRDLVRHYADDETHRRPAREIPAPDDEDGEDFPVADYGLDTEYDVGEGVTAGDLMTPGVRTVPATATMAQVAKTMVAERIHRVVVEDGGRHVGIIGTLDMLDALTG